MCASQNMLIFFYNLCNEVEVALIKPCRYRFCWIRNSWKQMYMIRIVHFPFGDHPWDDFRGNFHNFIHWFIFTLDFFQIIVLANRQNILNIFFSNSSRSWSINLVAKQDFKGVVAKQIMFKKKLRFRILKKRKNPQNDYQKSTKTIGLGRRMKSKKRILYKWWLIQRHARVELLTSMCAQQLDL